MEYPTAFFQELFVALPGNSLTKADRFSIHVTETCDTENYRIEQATTHGETDGLFYWEGDDWEDVLARCIAFQTLPF